MKTRKTVSKRITVSSPPPIPFEVSVQPESQGKSVFASDLLPTIGNLEGYRTPLDKMIETARQLQRRNIIVYQVSPFSISAACPRKEFESLFSTKLVEKPIPSGRHLALRESYL